MSIKLAPSILTADFGHIADQIRAAEAGGADMIHLDVMDGRCVPPITFGPLVVEAIRKVTRLPLDIHLMIEQPERHFEAFGEAGGDTIKAAKANPTLLTPAYFRKSRRFKRCIDSS